MNKHIKLLSIGLLIVISLLFTDHIEAALIPGPPQSLSPVSTDYVPLTTVPGVFQQGTATNPVAILKNLYGFAIGIGSVIGVVMIIYAGFEYMYVESISGKSDAKKRITDVFLGLAVILGSYLLLRTINPALVNFNVNLPSGGGRVAHLSIAQNLSNAANQQTLIALNQSATLRSEISALEKEVENLTNLIGTPDEDPGEHDANVAKLNALRASILSKKTQDTQLRTQANVGTVTTSIDENIYQRAAGLTTVTRNLPASQTSAINYFNSQLTELRALDQNNPEVKRAIEQVTARRDATAEEFGQQLLLERALLPFEGTNPTARQASATRLIADIRADAETHSKKLRDVGLVNEAKQYEERAQTRISSLCGANLCGN